MVLTVLEPKVMILGSAVLLDFLLGDPVYPLHPVRLMGRTLAVAERVLWHMGANGYVGGVALLIILLGIWVILPCAMVVLLAHHSLAAGLAIEAFLVYSMIALHDLFRHAWTVERAAQRGDLQAARSAISQLVGRDTLMMDLAACRRAAIESISENLTDGWASPLFWYALGGLPCLLLFKVVSTMDSMVGYKNERYFRFGWCGARTDDLLNWIPARLVWLLLSLMAVFVPGCSARQAFFIGWKQHAIVPGPNAGWSEAAMAGAIRRRLVGPIWNSGRIVTEAWLGKPSDPEAVGHDDFRRAAILVAATALACTALALLAIANW